MRRWAQRSWKSCTEMDNAAVGGGGCGVLRDGVGVGDSKMCSRIGSPQKARCLRLFCYDSQARTQPATESLRKTDEKTARFQDRVTVTWLHQGTA